MKSFIERSNILYTNSKSLALIVYGSQQTTCGRLSYFIFYQTTSLSSLRLFIPVTFLDCISQNAPLIMLAADLGAAVQNSNLSGL